MASQKKTDQRITATQISHILFVIARLTVAAGLTILVLTFGPLAKEEIRYAVKTAPKQITPIDKEFGIVIPKLGANARIIANVDPFNSKDYQYALTQGVAHARGTAVPGAMGNVFLFAHSSENFYEALQYNAIFYLIDKLVKGDQIDLYYHDVKFTYIVTEKKFVDPKNISYLTSKGKEQTVTLMTCWPPGTNLQRLLILGELTQPK